MIVPSTRTRTPGFKVRVVFSSNFTVLTAEVVFNSMRSLALNSRPMDLPRASPEATSKRKAPTMPWSEMSM